MVGGERGEGEGGRKRGGNRHERSLFEQKHCRDKNRVLQNA